MTTSAQPLRALRFILLALATGVLLFAVVAIALRAAGAMSEASDVGGLVLLVAAGLSVVQVPVYLVLRGTLVTRARAQKEESRALVKEGRVPPSLMQLAIVGAALAEGVGLLGVVAFLLGAPWYALAIPVLAVVLILAQLPSREGLERTLRGA